MGLRRAVITGLGALAPNGIGVDAFWEALLAGRSGIRPISRFDTSQFRSHIGGQVWDFQPKDFITAKHLSQMSLFTQFAVASSRLAYEDGGLNGHAVRPERVGLAAGATIGDPNDVYAREFEHFLKRGRRGVHYSISAEYTAHAATSHVSIELGHQGPTHTVSAGCTSGFEVLGWALNAIRMGELDMVLACASDSVLSPFYFATLDVLNILSARNDEPEKASRPYDADRDGSVASEGGGAVLVEERSHALERGARIYAELVSCGGSSFAREMIRPDREGESIYRCLKRVLEQADLRPEEIDYVCSHGVAIRDEDVAETLAFKRLLGERAYQVPVSSIKSMIGQPYAAGGILQVVALCKVLQTGWIPPTINLENPDPGCDLDYVAGQARRNNVKCALTNSQGVGGTQSAAILKKG